jgi:hypothetical protein
VGGHRESTKAVWTLEKSSRSAIVNAAEVVGVETSLLGGEKSQMTEKSERLGSIEAAPREAREAFYGAAVVGLRALDAREQTPRRFGAEANARWEQFRGSLGPADRIDILLRDAAVTWGVSFSPALAFGLFGLADDEPFGPDWRGITDDRAKRLLADATATDLATAARELGVKPLSVQVPSLTTSTRVIVAGGAAILAVAEAFKATPALSWADQVVVVATGAPHRQLAGLAAVAINAQRKTALVRPGENVAEILRSVSIPQVDAVVVSPDAEPEAAQFAQRAKAGR